MTCYICGATATEVHHLIYGSGFRELSDKYGLTERLCRDCHAKVHTQKMLMVWSKQEGQRRFEAIYGHDEYMRIFKRNFL